MSLKNIAALATVLPVLFSLFMFNVGLVGAQQLPTTQPPEIFPVSTWANLGRILKAAANLIFFVGLALVVIFIIFGGIKYATSGGDPKAAGEARNVITNAVIGLLVIGGVWVIMQLVVNLLGGAPAGWFPVF